MQMREERARGHRSQADQAIKGAVPAWIGMRGMNDCTNRQSCGRHRASTLRARLAAAIPAQIVKQVPRSACRTYRSVQDQSILHDRQGQALPCHCVRWRYRWGHHPQRLVRCLWRHCVSSVKPQKSCRNRWIPLSTQDASCRCWLWHSGRIKVYRGCRKSAVRKLPRWQLCR